MNDKLELTPFKLIRLIGRGAMGDVWQAQHLQEHMYVAIKFLRPQDNQLLNAYEELEMEARAAAGLNHPSVIVMLDYNTVSSDNSSPELRAEYSEGTPYLIMEYAPGDRWLDISGSYPWSVQRNIILQLLDVLSHAHSRGLVHRDIKPENVLINHTGREEMRTILLDFGLAQVVNEVTDGDELIAGTPAYMAPEQLLGEWRDLSPQTDLYSLGCSIWRILTGTAPYGNALPYQQAAMAHLQCFPPVLLNNIDVPSQVTNWLCRLLEKDPKDRFHSAVEAKEAFLSIPLETDRTTRKPLQEDNTATFSLTQPGERLGSGSFKDQTESLSMPIVEFLPPTDWRPPRKEATITHLKGVGLNLFSQRKFPVQAREKERDALWRVLINVQKQGAQVVLITGSVGCGKSTLAKWLGQRGKELGVCEYIRVQYSGMESAEDGIRSALLQLLRCRDLEETDLEERLIKIFSYSSSLKRMIPEFKSFLLSENTRQEEWERHAMLLHVLLRHLAYNRHRSTPSPVIIHIDDVHKGEEGLRFCRSVVESAQVRDIPILFVLTYQTEELKTRPVEKIELLNLQESNRCHNIALASFTLKQHKALIQDMLDLEADVVNELAQRTFGNPNFASEILSDWIQKDQLELGALGFTLKKGGRIHIPHSIEQTWSQRIVEATKMFGPEEYFLLETAAALGVYVSDTEWVLATKSISKEKRFYVTTELQRHRLFVKWKNQRGWTFSHPAIPGLVLQNARKNNRYDQAHLCAAEGVQQAHGPRVLERVGSLLLETDQEHDGLQKLLTALRNRIIRCDVPKAREISNKIRFALKRIDLPAHSTFSADLAIQEIELLVSSNEIHRASELLQHLETSTVLHPSSQCALHRVAGELALRKGELPSAIQHFTRGYDLALECNETDLLHRSLLGLSLSHINQGNFELASNHLQTLQQSARDHNDHLTLARHDQYLAIIYLQQSELEKATKLLNNIILFFAKNGQRKLQVESVNILGDVYRRMGKWSAAQKAYAKTLEIMKQIHHPNICVPMLNMAFVLLEQEDFWEAEPFILESLTILEQLNWKPMLSAAHLLLLCIHAQNYNWDSWDKHFKLASDLLVESQYIDSEIALFSQKAGQITKRAGEVMRAWSVLKIAVAQWKALDDLDSMMEARLMMLNDQESN